MEISNEFHKKVIEFFDKSNGDVIKTADSLCMERNQLYNILKRYGIKYTIPKQQQWIHKDSETFQKDPADYLERVFCQDPAKWDIGLRYERHL